MDFTQLGEFKKELKRLLKKYHSLNQDLDLLKGYLQLYPRGNPPRIFQINNLGIQTEIFKVKQFRCQSMKGKGSLSGIRIVYAFFPGEIKIEFVEIYYKEKDDTECNKERILRHYS
ncbi:MAG: hypothetical protein AUJ71_02310 [Candidatus Omnitrophica bacterium CG1_02_49_16]|nr:MAG: hypothetical protein AUJ71_02310 [Candidatus Omnitrophica bacterium CG1_02_49_16]